MSKSVETYIYLLLLRVFCYHRISCVCIKGVCDKRTFSTSQDYYSYNFSRFSDHESRWVECGCVQASEPRFFVTCPLLLLLTYRLRGGACGAVSARREVIVVVLLLINRLFTEHFLVPYNQLNTFFPLFFCYCYNNCSPALTTTLSYRCCTHTCPCTRPQQWLQNTLMLI